MDQLSVPSAHLAVKIGKPVIYKHDGSQAIAEIPDISDVGRALYTNVKQASTSEIVDQWVKSSTFYDKTHDLSDPKEKRAFLKDARNLWNLLTALGRHPHVKNLDFGKLLKRSTTLKINERETMAETLAQEFIAELQNPQGFQKKKRKI